MFASLLHSTSRRIVRKVECGVRSAEFRTRHSQFRILGSAFRIGLPLLGGLCLGFLNQAGAASITNVTLVNVTPSSFSVFWHAPEGTPGIEVFTDAAGTSSLAGQVGVELFPLHTGSPSVTTDYDQRVYRRWLQQLTRGFGLMQVRVTGCRPATTYYFRLRTTLAGGSTLVYPSSGALPSVTTPPGNTFALEAQQLLIDVPGVDSAGRVVLLTHPSASHALSAVVGDGCGTNQVIFNLSELFALTGGNFSPSGSQEFSVDVLGPNQTALGQQFAVNFTGAFRIAQSTLASFGTEFFALSIGSTMMQAGQTNTVPIAINSSAGCANLAFTIAMNTERLTNLTLTSLSPEIDPAAASVTRVNGTNWLVQLPARAGQTMLGAREVAHLRFTTIPNRPSAFVNLNLGGIQPRKPDSSFVANVISQSGRVVVIAAEPLMEVGADLGGNRRISMYGKPGSSYSLQYSTNLNDADGWTSMNRIPLTGMTAQFEGMHGNQGTYFYRVIEFFADPPLVDALVNPDGSRKILAYGLPSGQYTLRSAASLSGVVSWVPVLNYTLTNSFRYLAVPGTNGTIFYRSSRD